MEDEWGGTFREFRAPWGATLTVFEEDASHFEDILDSGVGWPYEIRQLVLLAKPGDVVVDVGANYGYTACLFAYEVEDQGHVLAMEPGPRMFDLLRRNVERNVPGRVTVVNAAVGSEPGRAQLHRSGSNLATHSLSPTLVPNVRDVVDVEVRTLDELCATYLPEREPDLLKVDVEGWELEVLRGGRAMLERARPTIWLEFWPDGIAAAGFDPKGVLDLMHELDYTITAHDLVREDVVDSSDEAILRYCEESGARFRAEGKFNRHGILYLHASV